MPCESRHLLLYLPLFRLERCGWSAEDQVVLVGERAGVPRVLALSKGADDLGLKVGMSLSQARAMAPDIQAELLDQPAETGDLSDLARQLEPISPRITCLPPDTMVAGLSPRPGPWSSSLEQREWALIDKVRHRMAYLGHQCRLVAAQDLYAARVLAAWSPEDRVIPSGALARALRPLPLQALAMPSSLLERLTALGLKSIGDLADLPAAAVGGRFGPQAVLFHRIARGQSQSLPIPNSMAEPDFARQQVLPFAIDTLEPLLFVLNRMLADLCESMEQACRAMVRLQLRLDLDGSSSMYFSFRTGKPTRDPSMLSRLLMRRLDGVTLHALVTAVALRASHHVPYQGLQQELPGIRLGSAQSAPCATPPTHYTSVGPGVAANPPGNEPSGPPTFRADPDQLAQLLAMLADTLGPGVLCSPAPRDTWRPECAWEPSEPLSGPQAGLLSGGGSASESSAGSFPGRGLRTSHENSFQKGTYKPDPAWVHESWIRRLPLARPALLLDEPRPIQVEPSSGGGVARLRSGRVWLRILHQDGPEYLSGEWWDQPFQRSYWVLGLEDGRLLWVYRERGHFFIHGFFDQDDWPEPARVIATVGDGPSAPR